MGARVSVCGTWYQVGGGGVDICEDTLNLDSKEYRPVSAEHRTFETAHLTPARAYPLRSFAYFSAPLMDEDG